MHIHILYASGMFFADKYIVLVIVAEVLLHYSPRNVNSIREHPTVARILDDEDLVKEPCTLSSLGRESDVLKMEWLALSDDPNERKSSKNRKTILLNGGAGVGKTDFARYLASWWFDTNFVQHAHRLDMISSDWEASLQKMCKELDLLDRSAASTGRTVYILDHLESRKIPTSREPLDKESKHRFKHAIRTLAGIDNIVIVISRKSEEWLHNSDIATP
jgi:hypothetical protein